MSTSEVQVCVNTNLQKQDLNNLDVCTLTPLSPEVISRQATINIGTIGHVAHGKSTVVKAISGVQTVRFKNELERNITIKLERINPQRMQRLLTSRNYLIEYEKRQDAKMKQKQRKNSMTQGQRQREFWSPTLSALWSSSNINRRRRMTISPSSGYESHNDSTSICSEDSLRLNANGKRCFTPSRGNMPRVKRKKDEYVVEAILAVECVNAQPVFFVKWYRYPSSSNTWESLENLAECALLDGFIQSMTFLHGQTISKISQQIEDKIKEENLHIPDAELNIKEIESYDPLKIKIDLIMLAQFVKAGSRSQKEPEKIRERVLRGFLIRPLYYRRKQQLVALEEWKSRINQLEHKAPITIENNVDLEFLDPNFQYILKSFFGKGVKSSVDVKAGCVCPDGCAPNAQCCARMAGSFFAYAKTGRLRIYAGEAIFECNGNCACSADCTNRVIQKGRQNSLCLFRTDNGSGWGVRTEKLMWKGEFVGEYVGEIITSDEANERGKEYDAVGCTYLFDLDFNDSAESMFTIDAAVHGNICRFFNHSCDPNLGVFPFWIDNLDINMPRLAFFTLRPIKAGEELTFDYTRSDLGFDDYTNLSDAEKTSCRCGAEKCRKVLF